MRRTKMEGGLGDVALADWKGPLLTFRAVPFLYSRAIALFRHGDTGNEVQETLGIKGVVERNGLLSLTTAHVHVGECTASVGVHPRSISVPIASRVQLPH